MHGLGPTWMIKSKVDRFGIFGNGSEVMKVCIFGVRF